MSSLPSRWVVCSLILCFSASAVAKGESLQQLLQYALVSDPILQEARAEQFVAESQVEQSKSLRWPTVRLTGNELIAQHHDDPDDDKSKDFIPGVEVSMNVYSFGAVDAEIAKSQANQQFKAHQYDESREELGYTIGDLYLTALNARESIRVLQRSLARHINIMGDLEVIVANDIGRESELVQGSARKILVQQQINDYQRLLETTLSSLAKYTKEPVQAMQLSVPFKNVTPEELQKDYALPIDENSPSYLAQQAELESSRHELEAEKAKRMPQINLVGSATTEDQTLSLNMSWDVFNRATKYSIQEKAGLERVAKQRLDRVARDVDESARLALIDIRRSLLQLQTLTAQMQANAEVIEFYKLQFTIARKTLIEVLNAENELADVELAYANTQTTLYRAVLSYLRSQGQIARWAGVDEGE